MLVCSETAAAQPPAYAGAHLALTTMAFARDVDALRDPLELPLPCRTAATRGHCGQDGSVPAPRDLQSPDRRLCV